jgi:hypothetical protein
MKAKINGSIETQVDSQIAADLHSIADRFAHGECGAFALACLQQYVHQGRQLVIFRGDAAPIHAACRVDDNLYFDAYGFVTRQEIDRYGMPIEPERIATNDVFNMFGIDEDDDLIDEAREHKSSLQSCQHQPDRL